ncbi:MAG: glycosyltransferase family 9 protein [Deltaproteobacteria bacterium]|nr:glycosyltransferase family 9 protein [Deltaproteobacteria bacterium]
MKILIIKLGAIGDVITASALIPFIQKNHPQAKITWMLGKSISPLLKLFDGIDEIIEVDEQKLLSGTFVQKIMGILKTWKKLFGRKFDIVYTAHTDPRYRLLSLTCVKPTHLYPNKKKAGQHFIAGRYRGDEYIRLWDSSAAPRQTSTYFANFKANALNKELNSQLRQSLAKTPQPFISLAPGGAKNALADNPQRRWPIENYVQLATKLHQANYSVVLTGGPSDTWVLPYFKETQVINLIGKTSLVELLQIYQKSSCLITHDSGPLHMARLVKCQTIGLFGPTEPQEVVGKDENVLSLWGGEELACRPCYDGRFFADCSDNQCLKSIATEKVMKIIQETLFIHEQRLH